MKGKFILSLAATLALACASPVPGFAHGKPEHGGAFTEVKEYTFEVVSKEHEEKESEKEHKENISLTVYVKDPSLKTVSSGTGKLQIFEGKKQVAEANLTSAAGAYTADASLPHDGKYKVAIDFTPAGGKPLKANVSIKVD